MPFDVFLSWVIRASLLLSAGSVQLPEKFAREIVSQSLADPIWKNDSGGAQRTMAILIALSWAEGRNRPQIVGDCKGLPAGSPECTTAAATSWCALQINLPNGSKTIEGWTGPQLAADPAKCVAVGLRLVRRSILACGDLTVYARGRCDSEVGKRLSNYRLTLAKRALSVDLVP